MNDATRYAIQIPFKVMQTALKSFELIKAMAELVIPTRFPMLV